MPGRSCDSSGGRLGAGGAPGGVRTCGGGGSSPPAAGRPAPAPRPTENTAARAPRCESGPSSWYAASGVPYQAASVVNRSGQPGVQWRGSHYACRRHGIAARLHLARLPAHRPAPRLPGHHPGRAALGDRRAPAGARQGELQPPHRHPGALVHGDAGDGGDPGVGLPPARAQPLGAAGRLRLQGVARAAHAAHLDPHVHRDARACAAATGHGRGSLHRRPQQGERAPPGAHRSPPRLGPHGERAARLRARRARRARDRRRGDRRLRAGARAPQRRAHHRRRARSAPRCSATGARWSTRW